MDTVGERLVLFAIGLIISVPISYILLKNCVNMNPRINSNKIHNENIDLV